MQHAQVIVLVACLLRSLRHRQWLWLAQVGLVAGTPAPTLEATLAAALGIASTLRQLLRLFRLVCLLHHPPPLQLHRPDRLLLLPQTHHLRLQVQLPKHGQGPARPAVRALAGL